jgi:hypothetical protein
MWTGLIWLRIGTSRELFWMRLWHFRFHKMLWKYREVATQLVAPRVVHSSIRREIEWWWLWYETEGSSWGLFHVQPLIGSTVRRKLDGGLQRPTYILQAVWEVPLCQKSGFVKQALIDMPPHDCAVLVSSLKPLNKFTPCLSKISLTQ